MQLNRTTLPNVRTSMQKALEELSKELNVSIIVGNATYESDGSNASFKVKIATKDVDGNINSQEVQDFKRHAELYGLKVTDLNRTFDDAFRGNRYMIVGLKPRSSKYPILCKRIKDGKTFKYPAEVVKRSLSK